MTDEPDAPTPAPEPPPMAGLITLTAEAEVIPGNPEPCDDEEPR